jgi:hypothetical protein
MDAEATVRESVQYAVEIQVKRYAPLARNNAH